MSDVGTGEDRIDPVFSHDGSAVACSYNDSKQTEMTATDTEAWPQEMPLCHLQFHFPFWMWTSVSYGPLLLELRAEQQLRVYFQTWFWYSHIQP